MAFFGCNILFTIVCFMIKNDNELQVTQERINRLQSILENLRHTARRDEFKAISSSYLAEIERMEAEVISYLNAQTPRSETGHIEEPSEHSTSSHELSIWQRESNFIKMWIAEGPVAGGRSWTREELYDRNVVSY